MVDSVHKCGIVITSLKAGRRIYFINCVFCSTIFFTMEDFAKHIEDKHFSEALDQEYMRHDMIEELTEITEANMEGQEEGNVFLNIEVLSDTQDEITEEFKRQLKDFEWDSNKVYTENTENGYEGTDVDFSDTDEQSSSGLLKMFDMETMATIFSNYENHSILWDSSDPISKNANLRSTAYKCIACDVGKPEQWKVIRDLIRKFSRRLRQELDRKRNCMLLDVEYTSRWVEDMKSFLKIKKENKKYVNPPSILTDSQRKSFIQIYESLTCLWNEINNDYRLPHKRQEAMNNFASLLKEVGISLTQLEIEQEISRLRKICWREKKRKLKCEEIKCLFVADYAYYDQIKFLESDVGPFRCETCKEIILGLNKFKVHISKHYGTKPFTCPLCDNGFTTVNGLNIHISRHTGEYKHFCKFCDKKFPALSELTVHERTHTGERPYCCDQCGKTFRVWVYYDSHIRRHQNRPGYECNVCSKKFFGAQYLNEHMSIHRKELDQICNVCGKGFKMAKYLRQHKQIHSVKKKYICKICDKAFAQYAGLSGHMKSHGTTLVDSNNGTNIIDDNGIDMVS